MTDQSPAAELNPMADEKPFTFHIAETRHYEFTVYAKDATQARKNGSQIWRTSSTTGQWELPDEETEYRVTEQLKEDSRG